MTDPVSGWETRRALLAGVTLERFCLDWGTMVHRGDGVTADDLLIGGGGEIEDEILVSEARYVIAVQLMTSPDSLRVDDWIRAVSEPSFVCCLHVDCISLPVSKLTPSGCRVVTFQSDGGSCGGLGVLRATSVSTILDEDIPSPDLCVDDFRVGVASTVVDVMNVNVSRLIDFLPGIALFLVGYRRLSEVDDFAGVVLSITVEILRSGDT